MISKQGLWFVTIFSLVLVLSVYYITMPSELLIGNNSKVDIDKVSSEVDDAKVSVEESNC